MVPIPYSSRLSVQDAELIRSWHEQGYRAARRQAGTDGQRVECLGLVLKVPPEVLKPAPGVSELLGNAVLVEVRPGERILDMGTGCGINGILAASRGCDVVAVDINPHAVAAMRANAVSNGVAERVDAYESDVFGSVQGVFDVIVFSPPFRWLAPRDLLEAATTDENYRTLRVFFGGVSEHLAPAGRLLLFFGSSGDLGFVQLLMDESGLRREVVARVEKERDGRQVEYLVYRMCR
jgi:release factor glutamine methyltransferase